MSNQVRGGAGGRKNPTWQLHLIRGQWAGDSPILFMEVFIYPTRPDREFTAPPHVATDSIMHTVKRLQPNQPVRESGAAREVTQTPDAGKQAGSHRNIPLFRISPLKINRDIPGQLFLSCLGLLTVEVVLQSAAAYKHTVVIRSLKLECQSSWRTRLCSQPRLRDSAVWGETRVRNNKRWTDSTTSLCLCNTVC